MKKLFEIPTDKALLIADENSLPSLQMLGLSAAALTRDFKNEILTAAVDQKIKRPLLIAVENSDRGSALRSELSALGFTEAYTCNLQGNFDSFKNRIAAIDRKEETAERLKQDIEKQLQAAAEMRRILRKDIMLKSASAEILNFTAQLQARRNHKAIETGFSKLDDILLGGGLYPALFTIGAVPAAGKSTLALQIAYNISESGHPIIFFSLEMDKFDITVKSLSRLTYVNNEKLGLSATQIVTGNYDKPRDENFMSALSAYEKGAKNLFIKASRELTVDDIAREVSVFLEVTGQNPVVVVDYFQLLKPKNDKNLTDKQIADINIVALKDISIKFHCPIIVVSTFNRQTYSGGSVKATLASYKESGGLEYCSDCAIVLEADEEETEKKSNPLVRSVSVRILKQKLGRCGEFKLNYYPAYNHFEEPNPFKKPKPAAEPNPFE